MQTPDDLDADGILLWMSFIEARQQERAADAAYRAARQALRSQPLTATPDERATVSQRYRDAVERRDDSIAARQTAERAYRAHRREMLAELRRGAVRQRDTPSRPPEREQALAAVRQLRQG